MGNERSHTSDGMPIGGWVLRADPETFDVGPMLEEFGQVFRYPLPPSDRIHDMAPGQPCFLFLADTSRVVGIWAVGEVVAPTFIAPVDPDDPGAGEQAFAEVELLPLEKAIALGKLQAHAAFAGGELVSSPDQANPVLLRPDEVRAIEEFDFTIIEPSDEQLARLEEVLGDDEDTGLVFQLIGIERSFGIRLDGDEDGLLSVFTISEEGAFELGRFQEFSDALELIALRSDGLELDEPVGAGPDDALPDGNPIAILQTEDGVLVIYRTDVSVFELFDPEPEEAEEADGDEGWDGQAGGPEHLGRFDSLADALAALAENVDEVDDDEGHEGHEGHEGGAEDADPEA